MIDGSRFHATKSGFHPPMACCSCSGLASSGRLGAREAADDWSRAALPDPLPRCGTPPFVLVSLRRCILSSITALSRILCLSIFLAVDGGGTATQSDMSSSSTMLCSGLSMAYILWVAPIHCGFYSNYGTNLHPGWTSEPTALLSSVLPPSTLYGADHLSSTNYQYCVGSNLNISTCFC